MIVGRKNDGKGGLFCFLLKPSLPLPSHRPDENDTDGLASILSSSMKDSGGKRVKLAGSSNENGSLKVEVEESSAAGDNKPAEESSKPSEPPKQDYIHVRARRVQATYSHSLAERAMHFCSWNTLPKLKTLNQFDKIINKEKPNKVVLKTISLDF
ncbi:transcription factor bHLH79-like [Pyrus communis]|uniref:transcription factor bHLH79-like n=1 Tax=Pyrus communis TaxID=23211 RepID=UPI0035C20442